VFSDCRDYGDERNNPNGTSATTCKVYEGLKYVAAHYEATYVWRGADDAYLNLQMWFEIEPLLPRGDIYMGHLRNTRDTSDLILAKQPLLQRQSFHMLERFGPYMLGMGFLLSASVVEFIAALRIPPKLTWCEDVMVGMWLLPFQIDWVDSNQLGFPILNRVDAIVLGRGNIAVLLTHYIQEKDWATIKDNGLLGFYFHCRRHLILCSAAFDGVVVWMCIFQRH
jgi:hypothetical protein